MNKQLPRTIDMTPTWESLVPTFLSILENPEGKFESKKIICEEITRMAQGADANVAAQKKEKKQNEKLTALLLAVQELPYEFNTELEWDTEGMPDGEKCDAFGSLLAKLKNQAGELLTELN